MVAHGNGPFLGMDVGGSQLFFLAASERIVLQFDMGECLKQKILLLPSISTFLAKW